MPTTRTATAFACTVLATLLGACADEALRAAAAAATTVDVVKVTNRDIERRVDLPGASVRGYESAELMAKLGGYVRSVHVDIGMEVRQGAVLAELDVPEMLLEVTEKETAVKQFAADLLSGHSEIEQAKAQIDADRALRNLREAEYRRIANLVRSEALGEERRDEARFALQAALAAITKSEADVLVAQARLASARARLDVAKATLAKSRAMLDYATIRAPFDGVITRRRIDRGAFVRPATSNSGATALLSIARVDKLRVVISVPMSEATRIRVGQPAVFKNIGGLPGESFEGAISRYAKALEPESRMMRAEIDLGNPADPDSGRRRLKPGMFGVVSLVVESLPQTPTVPATAVGVDRNGHYVMVVASGKCRRRPVEVLFNDAVTAGLSGLREGELVVAKDVTRLKNGQLVAVRR